MANEDVLEVGGEAEVAPPKSKTKMLVIIGVVVLFLGISATATLLLTGILSGEEQATPQAATETGKANKNKTAAKTRAPLNYVSLDPPFVVNFSADTDVRFLQVSVELGTRDVTVTEQIKEHRPAIRNNLVMLFGGQDPYELNTREGKEKLRAETLAEVQKVLKQETGNPGVESVFFTSFVMQ
jgi:flagellar FliL protein